MHFKNIPLFKGLITNYHDRIVPDDHLIECQNVVFDKGRVKTRCGLIEYGNNVPIGDASNNDDVIEVIDFRHIKENKERRVAITRLDSWCYWDNNWICITKKYVDGQAACAGVTAVTGAGTNWAETWVFKGQAYIKFGNTDVDAAGDWYEIVSVDSTTGLTLASAGPNTGGNVEYVIKFCWDSAERVDYTFGLDSDAEKVLIVTNKDDFIQKWEMNGCFEELGKDGVAELVIPDMFSTDFEGDARYHAVAAAYNGKVYVGTGWTGTPLTRDWWEYDIATSTWTQLTDFGGVARRSAVAAAYNGKVYEVP